MAGTFDHQVTHRQALIWVDFPTRRTSIHPKSAIGSTNAE